MDLAAEKGVSNWLTCRPLKHHGLSLHKGAFRDAVCLHYGWTPLRLPQSCTSGAAFTVLHALSCPVGGYSSLRHNELRDLTATMLTSAAHDTSIEPRLLPLSGENFHRRTAIREDGARLDADASGGRVWGGRGLSEPLFDIRVFNPHARPNSVHSIPAAYAKHEREKPSHYEERVREVEHATFVPLVFSATRAGPPGCLVPGHGGNCSLQAAWTDHQRQEE